MIVKFKTNAIFGESWEFIPDVSSFRHSKISKEQRQSKNLQLNDYIQHRDKNGKVYKDIEDYVYFQAWIKNTVKVDEPICIVTNMPTYLLNDEGKTIERINS